MVLACLLVYAGCASAAQPKSITEYRDHLQALAVLIAQCQQQTDGAHCNPDAVGTDDHVSIPGLPNSRLVSYAWLRGVFANVGDAKHPLSATVAAPLLEAVAERMRLEQAQIPGTSSVARSATDRSGIDRGAARSLLNGILSRAEFRHNDPSVTQRVLRTVEIWINRQLSGLADYSSHRRWLGRLLMWGLATLACLGLAVWFVQQTRRARGLNLGPAASFEPAPALRSWERWRQDAEQAAREQRWRDAVRAFYWAAIGRLEARGQWPVDRARTPREYLRLLVPDHPKRDDLRLLTRRFEACWYGASSATQPDCEAARQLFERLVAQ